MLAQVLGEVLGAHEAQQLVLVGADGDGKRALLQVRDDLAAEGCDAAAAGVGGGRGVGAAAAEVACTGEAPAALELFLACVVGEAKVGVC